MWGLLLCFESFDYSNFLIMMREILIGLSDVGLVWCVSAASLSQHDHGLTNGVYECESCKRLGLLANI